MFFRPPTGLHFAVTFVGLVNAIPGLPDIGFQEVTGLEASMGTEDFREGGENRFTHKLPTIAGFSNISLKRGMLVHSQMIDWFKSAIENFQFQPCDLIITLLNEEHLPVCIWNVVGAYPIKWSVSGLNAQDAQIVVEQVDLSYQYFRAVPIIP